MRRFLASLRPGPIALAFVTTYISAAVLSVVVAHALLIIKPASGLGERMVAPLARGLEFLDMHWKSVLIIVGLPFVAPMLEELLGRLTKAWGLEFVTLEGLGVREKSTKSPGTMP
jgi:hypothetical protein